MKHSYTVGCACKRCTREAARRAAQSANDPRPKVAAKVRRSRVRRPVVGSAEWAETRGDDIPSLDQPGDDFDMDGGE